MRKMFEKKLGWPYLMPGVYDACTALLAESAGFQITSVSGFCLSYTKLGKADVGLVTLKELSETVSNIAKVSQTPILVDADTGFGNAIGVMRTVEELIDSGAAALFIEDQVAPKKCGHMSGKMVVSSEEFEGKMRAADKVRRELAPDLLLVARSDAKGAVGGSIKDLIERGKRYRDAGADIFFAEALTSADEIEQCGREVGLPLLYNMAGISPRLPLKELADYGVFLVALPALVMQASIRGVMALLQGIREKGEQYIVQFEKELKGHPVDNIQQFVGFSDIRKLEEEFLPSAELLARYESSTSGYNLGAKKE
jgi:2-methylisocitrate lyase-like PEP mutase family enzyme